MSQIQSLRKQVLQLRQEANISRIPVSQACEETYVLLDIEVNEGTGTSCIMFSKGIQQLSLGVGHINVLEGPQSLMKFCLEHQKSDVLVYGISQSENPFKENKGCTLL